MKFKVRDLMIHQDTNVVEVRMRQTQSAADPGTFRSDLLWQLDRLLEP